MFPTYKAKFGSKVNGILCYGGVDASAPGLDDYNRAHRAMFNSESEAGAISVYAGLEVTQQAIEAAGEIDRKKIGDEIAKGPFQTIWGESNSRISATPILGPSANGRTARWSASSQGTKKGARPLQFPKPAWS